MNNNSPSEILEKAFLNAGRIMGMTSAQLNKILNSDVSHLNEINPKSKEGLRAIYFIRIYKKLHDLVSGDKVEMKLWMRGYNEGTGGIPVQQIQKEDIAGLVHVMEYLESLP